MNKTVLILGASGGFGLALTQHMASCAWSVKAVSRNPLSDERAKLRVPDSVEWLLGDISDNDFAHNAAEGVCAIVHALNAPYPKWDPLMIDYTQRIVELAQQREAQLFFTGNIYNAGIPASGVIDSSTPDQPVNNKGEIRAQIERLIRQGASTQSTTTIMRFGDFFGPHGTTTNWFKQSTKELHKNKLVLPGPADIKHTWAYLPDAVAAMEKVISMRVHGSAAVEQQPNHLVLPFAGHRFTFNELKKIIESHLQSQLETKNIPWRILKLMGFVVPVFRDLFDMRYLWKHDLRMDEANLVKYLGNTPRKTPLEKAVIACLPEMSKRAN